jgi:acyl-CoA hydrolase
VNTSLAALTLEQTGVNSDLVAAFTRTLKPGMTVALGDGVGALRYADGNASIAATLSVAAAEVGDIGLVLGWLPAPLSDLQPEAFRDVVALMPGWGVRQTLRSPRARFVPTSLAGIAALLSGPLRPDVLITRLVRRDGQLRFSTEVSWQHELICTGTPVLAILDTAAPAADAVRDIDPTRVEIIGHSAEGPVVVPNREPEALHAALAEQVCRLVPAGARLQYGPGQLGNALLARLGVPVRIDTGLLTDAVVDLDRRGLLLGDPTATYLIGSEVLYEWADARPILRGIEYTHDLTRLSRGVPFVAVNTAIEIDRAGQVNVEGVQDNVVGGIGGHPDFCAGARMSRQGLSIIAVQSSFNGRSPLVEQLSRPASTPAHDVDVVVTENGFADLRGADWVLRRHRLEKLFA